MTKGVIYFNRGTKCMVRLLVSLHSLRKHYSGDVSVIQVGEPEAWFVKVVKSLNATIVDMPDNNSSSLSFKGSLWRYSPYDLTMFLDSDTIVFNKIDDYFKLIEENDFVTGGFANWKTTGGTISKRIKQWSSVASDLIDDAISFGKAVNTGVNGWKKGASILSEWERLCQLGYEGRCTLRVLDGVACQILLPQHRCHVADTKWGESVKYGKLNDETVIVHYHGSKHAGDREANYIWKTHYNELRHKFSIPELNLHHGDRAFRSYLRSKRSDLTIVTAVNSKYFDKLKNNFPLWQKTENLMEYPLIVFAHKDIFNEVVSYFKRFNHVRVLKWEFKAAEGNIREEMLSAFVFGAARHVRTKYWMKLDCDVTPKNSKLEIPEEAWKSVITATAWGYTKVKGDTSGSTKHWLNRLDDFADNLKDFEGTKRLFPDNIEGKTFRHKRINSFCEIEKTAWTKHVARMCGDRLPVPSQDTVTCYAATRLGRKITTFKFKKYLSN